MVACKSAGAVPARAYVTIRTTAALAQVGGSKFILRICSVSFLAVSVLRVAFIRDINLSLGALKLEMGYRKAG